MLGALKNRGYSEVSVILQNSGGAVSMFNGLREQIEQDGSISIRNVHYVNSDMRDFRILLYKIKEEKPQIVVLLTQTPETDIILRQAKESNLEIPFTALQSYTFLRDKNLADNSWYVDQAMAIDKNWYDRYKEISDNDVTDFAENVYAILQVIRHIYETSNEKKLTGEGFVNNLHNADGLETAIGKLIYDKENQNLDTPTSCIACSWKQRSQQIWKWSCGLVFLQGVTPVFFVD